MFKPTRPFAAALLALTIAGSAHAATYAVSGRFGTTVYTGPLNGGSFAGTYDLARPSIGSFDIRLYDASNVLRAELTNANSHANFISNFGASGFDAIQFVANLPDSSASLLSLDFQLGFTGLGTVVPYPNGFPFTSFGTLNGNAASATSIVVSGISAAVPEPATWALLLAGVAALGFGRARART